MADRALTGVLLVGGASSRFGSPKALARLRGETLAERAWRTLGEACDERIAVGKGDLNLPFEVLIEPAEPQAPITGVVTGLRASSHEIAVFLPVDCPLVTPQLLRELGEHAAVPRTGPLPGAYTKDDLPELERRLRLVTRCAVSTCGCARSIWISLQTWTRRTRSQRSKSTSPLSTSTGPDSVSTMSRPSRAIICAVPATPSTVTRRPRRKSRAPRSS